MSEQRVCDLSGHPIDPLRDDFYTVVEARSGVTKDICDQCCRSRDVTIMWTPNTPYVVGNRVYPPPELGFGLVHEVTVAGTSGASQPTWAIARDDETVDNTVTYVAKLAPLGLARVYVSLQGNPLTGNRSFSGWMLETGEIP